MLRILPADTKDAVNHASALFWEYAASLTVNLSFQGFEKEVGSLPGEYAPPDGGLLLAFIDEPQAAPSVEPAGCVALRKIDREVCEMKRLYVRSSHRGRGIGRALALAAVDSAQKIGYSRMFLDTLPEMKQAQKMYFSLGFKEIPAYRFNPVPGARFMELILQSREGV